MKYIRTKDGKILKIRNKQLRPNGVYDTWYVGNNYSMLYNRNHDLIEKEADTIEELCDEFVYLMESGRHICKNKHTEIMYCLGRDEPIAYYGAIWTDRGLIYVAKMNDKGELELL